VARSLLGPSAEDSSGRSSQVGRARSILYACGTALTPTQHKALSRKENLILPRLNFLATCGEILHLSSDWRGSLQKRVAELFLPFEFRRPLVHLINRSAWIEAFTIG
jgi:hypothetical protein